MRIEDLMQAVTGEDTVTQPSHSKMTERGKKAVGEKPYQDHRSKSDTETLIKNIIAEAGQPMTVTQIARRLNRAASPHLRRVIVDMVQRAELVETVDVAPNGRMHRYWYSLP